MNPTNDHRTLAPPLCPELMQRHFDAECAFTAALAQFQATVQPIPNFALATVLEAARPALAQGFCYLIREQRGELVEVALRHKDGAEEISCAPLDVAAPGLLLAELLGIPVLAASQDIEPDQHAECSISAHSAEPQVMDATLEPADEPDLIGPDSPADIPGDDPGLAPLTEQQAITAVAMIKAMDPVGRKSFQIAFRNAFELDRNVRQITPHITQLRHLEFIDRFTIEAAGGIAA